VPARDRLDILDGLRGVAILLVLWYHVWLVSGQDFGPLDFIAKSGFLGVDLFFFISGFCLFYPYARAKLEGRAEPTTRRFFERRFLKIVPSYLIVLAVFVTMYRPQDAALQIATHLAFVHPFSTYTFGAISGPLWTIGIEVQFYLLFPLIVKWFRRSPLLGYAALFAVSESYRAALTASGNGTSFLLINQLPAFFDVFGAGMFAAYALVALRKRPLPSAGTMTAASVAAFAAGLAGLGFASHAFTTLSADEAHGWMNAYRFAIGPLCIAIAVTTFFSADRWRSIVGTRVLVFLSAISYNVYLWHLEIVVWVHNAGLPAVWTLVAAVPIAVGVAALITFAVERPILEGTLPATFARLTAALERLYWRAAAAAEANEYAATRSTNSRVLSSTRSASMSKLPPMSNIVSEP
jgi:peptidoglycan/LPS O-acetylase OafA/YrhL